MLNIKAVEVIIEENNSLSKYKKFLSITCRENTLLGIDNFLYLNNHM